MQETCSLIQAAVLRTASRLFHRGLLANVSEKNYEHLFDVPQHSRTDNDVSGLSPYLHPDRRLIMRFRVRIVAGDAFLSTVKSNV